MSFFPDITTFFAIDLGSFHLRITWYAIFILTGALLAYSLSLREAKKRGYDKEILENFFLSMLPIAIVGARFYYVIFEWARFASEPISALYIWEGGLAIHGGLIAAIIYAYFYFRHYGINLLRVGDCIMPNVLIAQVIGRWGNFMNQEAYGEIVGANYFNHFPEFIKNHMYIEGSYRMPMFLYEGIGNLIGFFLIKFVFKKYGYRKRGDMIYAYIAWYGMVRFFVEMFRTDALMFAGLRVAQIVSLLFVLIGVLGILGVYTKVFKKFYPFKKERPIILFDADGTLVDSEKLIQDSFIYTFAKFLPKQNLKEEELRSFLGPPLYDTFAKYLSKEKAEEAVEYYREYNHKNHDASICAHQNAKIVVKKLKEDGYTIGVVSNKMSDLVHRGLACCELNEYIDVVIGRDMVDHAKPNAEGIKKACALANYPVDDIIYVGDAPVDILAARNIDAIGIGYAVDEYKERCLQEVNAQYIIHDFLELETIIKEI